MNLIDIFRRKKNKKKNAMPIPDIVPDTFLGMMSKHKSISSYTGNNRIIHYPYGLSDEEREVLKKECEVKGYQFIEINTIQSNKTQHDT